MKKLILISALLFSFNGWAENYSCRINEVFKGSSGQLDGVATNRSAKRKVGSRFEVNYDTCEFNGQKFDIITINSVLHHFPDPARLLANLEDHLEPGGLIIGGHEPNVQFAQNPLARLAARIYKGLGGAVEFPEEMLDKFNQELESGNDTRGFPRVNQEEVQQVVDWHSPTEQDLHTIAQGVGFNGKEFLKKSLTSCDSDIYEE